MRKLAYILPAVLMSGCSLFSQTPTHNVGNQYYAPNCQPSPCQAGQSYAVSGENTYTAYSAQSTVSPYASAPAVTTSYAAPQQYVTQQAVQQIPGLRGSIPYSSQILDSSVAYVAPAAYAAAPALRRAKRRNPGYFYGTLGAVVHDTTIDSVGIEGRLGYQSGLFLGAEIEGSYGVIEDNDILPTSTGPVFVEQGFDYNAAGFAIARLPISKRLSLHARGGYDYRSLDVVALDSVGNIASVETNLDGFAYGAGGEFSLSPNQGIRVDYTRYENDINNTADSLSASYFVRF